jgi:hypothetical protein
MGPVASVLLPRSLSEREVAALHETVQAVSNHDLDQPPAPGAF